MPTDLILEMKGVSKRFGGLTALDRVDFTLRPGEVHALIGENGAGKSTLMKVLGGVHRRDEGTIVYKGREVDFADPNESMDAGISIIYQELSALPSLSVTENLFMGRMPTRLGVIDWKHLERESRKALAQVGLGDIHPGTLMKTLSIAQRQLIFKVPGFKPPPLGGIASAGGCG